MMILEILYSAAAAAAAGAIGLLFLKAKRYTFLTGLTPVLLLQAGIAYLPIAQPLKMLLTCALTAGLAVYFAEREKRNAGDGWLLFSVSLSAYGLFDIFRGSLVRFPDLSLLYWGTCMAAAAAVLLVFLLCPKISLAEDWRSTLEDTGADAEEREAAAMRVWYIYALSGLLLLLIYAVFPAISGDTEAGGISKAVLAAVLYAGCLGMMVLLTAYFREKKMYTDEYSYRNEMKNFMNVVRSQRHDYNLHVQTAASLIQQQKWDECREYVNALVKDTAEMNTILPVRDPAIAAMIHNYRIAAAQKNIRLSVDIRDDLSNVVTSVYETNKIIGNLLQNAIDETECQEDRSAGIQLEIFKRGEFCLIRVTNRVQDPQAFLQKKEEIFNQGYTTKKGHDGVGLSSIQTLMKRIEGDICSWEEGETVHFIAAVPESYAEVRKVGKEESDALG